MSTSIPSSPQAHPDSHGGIMRQVLEAIEELNQCRDLDETLRKGVELARTHLGHVRAGIYLLPDEKSQFLQGAYGTDILGNTTNESSHMISRALTLAPLEQLHRESGARHRVRNPSTLSWWDGTRKVEFGKAWVSGHMLFSRQTLVGLLYVDSGSSGSEPDEDLLNVTDLYCQILGGFIDRRRFEAALREADTVRLDSLGVLAGGIAHDFNNLLAAVLGNLELALVGQDPERAQSRLLDARRATLQAKELAGRLLTFARGGDPVRRPLNVIQLLEQTARMAIGTAPVEWSLDTPAELPSILADESQMIQVLQNLILNACQHMPEGGSLFIEAKTHLNATGRMVIRIRIKDTGPGIPAGLEGRIFEPYFTTRKLGNGLGLATARSVMRRHGGNLRLITEYTKGACFEIEIPASDQSPTGSDSSWIPMDSIMPDRVLILDDEASLRSIMEQILLENGVRQVITAADGNEAIALWEEAKDSGLPFDVGIFDLRIPGGMGGLEAARQLLALDPQVRLIACSGYASDPVLANPQQFGFRGRVVKPYRMKDLLTEVRRVSMLPRLESSNESNGTRL